MKRFILFFSLLALSLSIMAQPGPYAVVSYFKVDPGKATAYVKMEKELWKPIHQARLKAGEILGWYCFGVDFAGSGSEYNYVTVTVVENLAKMDNVDFQKWFKTVHPKRPIEEITKTTTDARVMVRSELIRRVGAAVPAKAPEKRAPMISVSFFNALPGKEEAYSKLVSDVFMPVSKAMVEADPAADFGFWEVWLPNGSSATYNYVGEGALPSYASMSDEEGGKKYDEVFKKVHPHLDQKQMREMLTSMRTRVKQEIWWTEDFVE